MSFLSGLSYPLEQPQRGYTDINTVLLVMYIALLDLSIAAVVRIV
jgi:hypothetical protein